MPSLNSVELIGNLGKNPETTTTKTGKTITTFRLATNDRWKDADGKAQERTEWHNIEVWGAQAKTCSQYLTTGRLVMVLGSLKTDQWDKDGVKHSRTKVVAARVLFLDSPSKTEEVTGDKPGEEIPF